MGGFLRLQNLHRFLKAVQNKEKNCLDTQQRRRKQGTISSLESVCPLVRFQGGRVPTLGDSAPQAPGMGGRGHRSGSTRRYQGGCATLLGRNCPGGRFRGSDPGRPLAPRALSPEESCPLPPRRPSQPPPWSRASSAGPCA